MRFGAQFAKHFPAHPQQQQSTGQGNADDRQELDGDGTEGNAQQGGAGDAPEYGAAFLRLRQAGHRNADNNGVVAGQSDVDHQHLHKGMPVGLQMPKKGGHVHASMLQEAF